MITSTGLTKYIGLAFIVLAIARFTPSINVTGKFILCVGISSFCFIIGDYALFFLEGLTSGKRLKKVLTVVHNTSSFCAILVAIVLVNVDLDISVKMVNALSDSVTLAGLGFVIMLMGLKSDRMLKRYFNEKITDFKG